MKRDLDDWTLRYLAQDFIGNKAAFSLEIHRVAALESFGRNPQPTIERADRYWQWCYKEGVDRQEEL